MKLAKKTPSLEVVSDQIAADKLRELLRDADDGLRRVVRCGLYIEWVSANLPHGQLMPWLEANCPDVSNNTVLRWRTLAKNICEWSGFKFAQWANLPATNALLLDCPVDELPVKLRAAREKMDELLDSARTPKQLFFDMGFKQGELDTHGYPKAKRGRRVGEGGKPAAPTTDIEAMVAFHSGGALRKMGKVADGLDNLGVAFLSQPDDVLMAWDSKLSRTSRCVNEWLNTPLGKRDRVAMERILKLYHTL
jgi:hypothetical protein